MSSQDPAADRRARSSRSGPVETEPVEPGRPRSRVVGGRFVIDRLIARGGMGAVYLAHQLNLGRAVALKVMTPPPDGDDVAGFADRFRLEAETLAALHHPNIVTVYDYGPTEDGRYYLALEYVDGPRFTDLIRGTRMAPERTVRLMLQVCQALRYAHKRGVVHRDLKPSNLLVRVEDGVETVKVVDFGLVKVAEADQSITRAGLVLGSPHCMSPEQVKGTEIDQRADIYAIGILFFRALTGTWPFHGETVPATMIAHVHEERPSFASAAPDLMVPEGLEAIVQKCMARDPDDRYQDADALIDALTRCLDIPEDQLVTVSSYQLSLQGDGPAAPVKRPWLVPAVAIAALALVVGGLAITQPWGGDDTPAPAAMPGPSAGTPAPVATPPAEPTGPPSAEPPPAEPLPAEPADEAGTAAAEGPAGADSADLPASADDARGSSRDEAPETSPPAAKPAPSAKASPASKPAPPPADPADPPADAAPAPDETPTGYMPLPEDF